MRAPNKTEAEFAALFDYVDSCSDPLKYRLMLLLSVKLGLRPKEIAGLNRSWFRGDELRIPHGYSKGKGGHGSLPVCAEVLAALSAYMGDREGVVFLNRGGRPFDAAGISSALRRLYREAGQEGSCYSGRRTLATNMVDRGVNLLVVQKVLRHSSPVTTQQYVGVTQNMLSKALYG